MEPRATAAIPRVQLVSKPAPPTTGIGRYAAEVAWGVRDAEIESRQASLRTHVATPLRLAGNLGGYDLDSFLRSYPMRADTRRGYITHLTSQSLATLLLTQRLPRPVVVTVHDILPYLLRDDPDLCVYRNRAERLIDGLTMRALHRADRLIAISHYTKRTMIEALDLPPRQIEVVHNGVDTVRFKPMHVPATFRERYGIPPAVTCVLYVGSEDPRKNLPLLLRSLALLRRDGEGEKVMLLKVGAPAFAEQRARHERLCRELGIENAVRWIDEVPEADLPMFYNVARVFAFPSRYEGFGLPVLEALACGTSVVALRSSSIPELVGTTATLVEVSDPVLFASAIERAIEQRGADSRERVAQARLFTWSRSICGLLKVYEQLENRDSALA